MISFQKAVFKEILDHYPKFFLHILPHPRLVIGSRGLIGEESKNGIVLVFSGTSYDKLELGRDFITVNMKFGGTWEALYIPMEAVSAAFNDPVTPEFMFSFKFRNKPDSEIDDLDEDDDETEKEEVDYGENVIPLHPRK